MKALDIHKGLRRLKLATERIKKSESISEENRELILDFRDFCFAEDLSVERVEHYLHILNKIAERMKMNGVDFSDASKDDIVELVGWV